MPMSAWLSSTLRWLLSATDSLFFNGLDDPTGLDGFAQRVGFDPQFLGHRMAPVPLVDQLLGLLPHRRRQHPGLARRARLEKTRRSALPVFLPIPLHADDADPKGPHDLRLRAIAI